MEDAALSSAEELSIEETVEIVVGVGVVDGVEVETEVDTEADEGVVELELLKCTALAKDIIVFTMVFKFKFKINHLTIGHSLNPATSMSLKTHLSVLQVLGPNSHHL